MMPTKPWRPIGCAAFMTMTAACASTPPTSAPPRVQLTLPAEATRPCRLPTLAPSADIGALEEAYMARGEALVACDAARRLAVVTLLAERAADAAARAR